MKELNAARSSMEYRILGPLEVTIDGARVPLGPPKQRALLAVLALHANRVVSTDRLIGELWGESPPRTADHSLQTYVSGLRNALAPGVTDPAGQVIVTRPPGYQLTVDPDSIDLLRFEEQLEEQILLQDPGLAPERRLPPAAGVGDPDMRNPYKGLQAFSEDDALDYFGREALTTQLVSVLESSRLVAVVGPSGCGKSSVVRAGLIPALRRGAIAGSERWLIARMMPGAHPYAELEAALLRAAPHPPDSLMDQLQSDDLGLLRAVLRVLPDESTQLVLMLDQFEELFSLVDDEANRRRFLDDLVTTLTDPHSRLRVVLTLRADFYDRPLLYPEFGSLFTRTVVNVMPLTAEELERAAIRPAASVGISFEPALLAQLVADVTHQPGGLPLFQYALTELFERREGGTLTLDAYRQIGGLDGALTRRSEELYGRLRPDEQEAARQVFLRLVTLSESMEETRRRVPAGEVMSVEVDPAAVETAIELFATHRLITFDRDPLTGAPTLEVAHEALLREWDRLREWIDSSRDDLRRHGAFAAAVDEWVSADRQVDYLLSGNRLEQYEQWELGSSMRLTALERAFLMESIARRDERQLAEEARREAERRLVRRARRRLTSLISLFVTIAAGAALATIVLLGGETPQVALVFEGRGDRGWGDLEAAGLDRAALEFDIEAFDLLPLVDPLEETRSLIESGFDLVILSGATYSDPLALAPEYPSVWFAMIDGGDWTDPSFLEQPNIVDLEFAEAEGSYLVGVAAALTSTTGTIGYVGGGPVRLLWEFQAGYEAGARSVDPDIEILVTWVSDRLFEGFADPDGGEAAARRLYEQGADVVYHAAGLSGVGVHRAAVELSKETGTHLWMIGSDEDEYWAGSAESRPHVLTSMMKRTDEAIFRTVSGFLDGTLTAGRTVLGLKDGGVGYSQSGGFLTEHLPRLEEARTAIINGAIEVPTAPSGESTVIPPFDIADADKVGSVVFGPEGCRFEEPEPLFANELMGLRLANHHDAPILVAVFRLLEEVPFDPTPAAAAPMPAYADPDNQATFFLEPGQTWSTNGTMVEGTYRVVCLTTFEEAPMVYPAAEFEVGGG
ncbi:MAG: BMP family ABC transporter substrate-binding protein [Acidimicrobiia bacterium]|nr:BMP family ABC transporter substrate-binding protein [Acidimicrobiia bacterium]